MMKGTCLSSGYRYKMQPSINLPNLSAYTEMSRAALIGTEGRVSCGEMKNSNFSIVSLTSSEEELRSIDSQALGLSPDNINMAIDEAGLNSKRKSGSFSAYSVFSSYQSDSSLGLSELGSNAETDACGRCDDLLNQDVVIDMPAYSIDMPKVEEFDFNLLDPPLSETDELNTLLDLDSPDVSIKLQPLLDRIKDCKDLYQLHSLRAELFPDESAELSEVISFSRLFSEAEIKTLEQKCALERGFYNLHAWIEKHVPYSFRAGQNINLRCLLHALFQKDTSDNNPLFEALSTLTQEQVKKIAYSLTGLLIYLPTFIYQLPKFSDEIKRIRETGKVSGTLILKGAFFSSSLLYMTATLLLLGGVGSAANVVRMIASGINLLDVPAALCALAESWIDFYKYAAKHSIPARQFMVKESSHKTTMRIATETLTLMGSLAGKVCYELNTGSARLMLGIFGLNCANLPFQQNPFEAITIGAPLLKKERYVPSAEIDHLQCLAMCADFAAIASLIASLENNHGKVKYTFNGRRVLVENEKAFFSTLLTSFSTGNRAFLTKEALDKSLFFLHALYEGTYSSLNLPADFPVPIKVLFDRLDKLRASDLSCGTSNAVYEKCIAVMVKVFAFREHLAEKTINNNQQEDELVEVVVLK